MDRRWVYAGLVAVAGIGLVRVLRASRIKPGETRILLLGDSLAVGLATPLKALGLEQKIPVLGIGKTSTRIDQWAQSGTLLDQLSAFKPTLILVSLGTNDEYLTGDAAARQKPYLDQLVKRFGEIDYAWIGPPTLPKPTTNGITALLQSRIPSSHYFPSHTLQIPRGPDNLHPTAKGYAGWAGALWQWLS